MTRAPIIPPARAPCCNKSHPLSLADAATLWGGETYHAWAEASYSLRTGRSAFRKQHGKNFFDFLNERPEQLQSSHRAFAAYARHDYRLLSDAFELRSARSYPGRWRRHW